VAEIPAAPEPVLPEVSAALAVPALPALEEVAPAVAAVAPAVDPAVAGEVATPALPAALEPPVTCGSTLVLSSEQPLASALDNVRALSTLRKCRNVTMVVNGSLGGKGNAVGMSAFGRPP
jgi:hypothetical protein